MYIRNYQGSNTIQLTFNAKVDKFIAKVLERDPTANIDIGTENCVYPEETNQFGQPAQMQDTSITIEGSNGVVSKYSTYINSDGTIGGVTYQ